MRAIFTLTIGLISAGPLAAQGLDDVCRALSHVTVGQWAEYRFAASDPGESMTMTNALVDTEDVDGVTHYWHETRMAGEEGAMIMQILVPGYPFDIDDIRRSVMKVGDEPAMEVPDQMLGMTRQQGAGDDPANDAAQRCEELTEVGRESVTVPAGTFEAVHVRHESEGDRYDMWVAPEVPFGMVRMLLPDQEEVVLLGHGTDATSSIARDPRRP